MLYRFMIEPVAKGRPRFATRGGYARVYTDTKTKHYENSLRKSATLQHEKPPLEGALEVSVSFHLRRPASVKRKHPSVKPDVDNFLKALFDSVNGIIWIDDAQIIKCTVSKQYAEKEAFINLEVTEIKDLQA